MVRKEGRWKRGAGEIRGGVEKSRIEENERKMWKKVKDVNIKRKRKKGVSKRRVERRREDHEKA